MDKYEKVEVVGEGSYGLVMKCRHKESGQLVAIKKFLETEEDQTVRKMALREIRMLKKLRHENLVNMIEVFRRSRRYYLVFEYMDHTILDELEEHPNGLGEEATREHIFQVVRGIDFCHASKVLHRDVKPENILVSKLGVIKLCDFGFARLMATQGDTYTDYVATRWYRAPELLVGDTKYGKEVDIWAIGCLFSEMMTGEPLFPGESDIDQLFQITRLLGRLSHRHHQLVLRNAMFKGLKKPCDDVGTSRSLAKRFPSWPYLALDFVTLCLKLDPAQRPTSRELLQHPYFLHDNFVERFLPELRAKVHREFNANPLLRNLDQPSLAGSAAKRVKERVSGDDGSRSSSFLQRRGSYIEPPRWKLNLINDSLMNNENRKSSLDKSAALNALPPRRRLSENNNNNNNNNNNSNNNNNNNAAVTMEVSDESSGGGGGGCRHNLAGSVMFTKLGGRSQVQQQVQLQEEAEPSFVVGVSPPSPSPPPFQSLQTSHFVAAPQTPTHTAFVQQQQHQSQHQQQQGGGEQGSGLQVLHPSINNLCFGAGENLQTSFNTSSRLNLDSLKRSPQPLTVRSKERLQQLNYGSPLQLAAIPRTHLIRRLDRGLIVDVSQLDKSQASQLSHESSSHDKWQQQQQQMQMQQNNRRKANENAAWKANKMADDFSLPNVPGASGSPNKGLKKKLVGKNAGDPFATSNENSSRPTSQSPKIRYSSKNFPFFKN